MKNRKPARFVYLFHPRFAPLVEAGLKRQTVRPTPKRMPKPGDRISLRTWPAKPYRSKQRVLAESTICRVAEVDINFYGVMWINGSQVKPGFLDEFARADGFVNYSEMLEWMRRRYGFGFHGIVIYWEKPGGGNEKGQR